MGADGVFDVVGVVGDAVGGGGDLCFECGHGACFVEWADVEAAGSGGVGCVVGGGVFCEPFAGFEGEVEASELGEGVFEVVDDAEGLDVVLETAVVGHEFLEGGLSGVPEGRVAEVVGEGDDFGEPFVEAQGDGDASGGFGDFEGVGEAGAEVVVSDVDEDLGLVLKAAESGAAEDALAVAFEGVSERVGGFVVDAA